jgi:quinol monooxygenase YgiN
MPRIRENQLFTVLVEFEVDPGHPEQLIAALADQVQQRLTHDAGFVSASFHATEDGTRVFNYAQWRSREDYESFLHRDSDELENVFNRFNARLLKLDYPLRVARVVEKPGTDL